MNGNEPKIEIFEPFGAAFELTKRILFQPFDVGKWCVIGFAAFLAQLGGSGFRLNYNRNLGSGSWNLHSMSHNAVGSTNQMAPWLIPLGILGALIVLAIVVAVMWVGARGRFIFTDCIVRNRGAIAEPWREFRREGNSFFLFSLLVGLVILAVIAIAFVPVLLPFLHDRAGGAAAFSWTIGIVSVVGVILFIVVGWVLISQLMVPVMYRQRCKAAQAFAEVVRLISTYPGSIVLYLLFFFVLALAVAMVACLSACITCCLTAIPYVGTVILLPIYVLLGAFPLIFLRQFGTEFDVWASAATPEPPSPPSTPPPLPTP